MARLGLGEGRGWIELHQDGRADLYTADVSDGPIFQFNAEDGELLTTLGQELTAMLALWKESQREMSRAEWELGSNPAQRAIDAEPEPPEEEPLEDDEEADRDGEDDTPEKKSPVEIVKGGSPSLQEFALK